MTVCRSIVFAAAILCTTCAGAQETASASSAASDPRARQMIEGAVHSEIAAADRDHSNWTYRDHDRTPEKDALYRVVETPAGSLRRMIELHGRPVDAGTARSETQRIDSFVHDTSAQARERRAGEHDDRQAREMLEMLPKAFIWTIKSDNGDLATLAFRPDPNFHAPNIEARVMAAMAGELIVAKSDNRIRTLRGRLTEDVKIGYGIFGRLREGGTFNIERREIAPHVWEITESHVHIDGRALLFKTIGQQEDEVKSEWKPSTARTLEEAARQLGTD